MARVGARRKSGLLASHEATHSTSAGASAGIRGPVAKSRSREHSRRGFFELLVPPRSWAHPVLPESALGEDTILQCQTTGSEAAGARTYGVLSRSQRLHQALDGRRNPHEAHPRESATEIRFAASTTDDFHRRCRRCAI